MTPEHEYDLTLCHQILAQDFAFAGLIGSATKWARFRKRLAALGTRRIMTRSNARSAIRRWARHPQAIAIGVAATALAGTSAHAAQEDVA